MCKWEGELESRKLPSFVFAFFSHLGVVMPLIHSFWVMQNVLAKIRNERKKQKILGLFTSCLESPPCWGKNLSPQNYPSNYTVSNHFWSLYLIGFRDYIKTLLHTKKSSVIIKPKFKIQNEIWYIKCENLNQ